MLASTRECRRLRVARRLRSLEAIDRNCLFTVAEWIGHFHTGGNPGRHEIDDSQELNYHFVAQAIADLSFTGYVAHEYSPAPGRDPLASLAQAMKIMQV